MGCDIHLALERRLVNKEKREYTTKFNVDKRKYEVVEDDGKVANIMSAYKQKWHACTILGEVEIGDRIYGLFANLAGVRGEWGNDKKYPEPKGLPSDAGLQVKHGYTILVNDYLADKYNNGTYDEFVISEEQAKEWSSKYNCETMHLGRLSDNDKNKEKRITSPDYHSASWASRQELEKAFNKTFRKKCKDHFILMGEYSYYLGIISLMKTFEENGDYEVRMVYWFDN